MGGVEMISVEVNNVLVNTEIHNVFGVIEGFIDSGMRYTPVVTKKKKLGSHVSHELCVCVRQTSMWFWERRGTRGVKATPALLSAPPFSWNWPRPLKTWWKEVNNKKIIMYFLLHVTFFKWLPTVDKFVF